MNPPRKSPSKETSRKKHQITLGGDRLLVFGPLVPSIAKLPIHKEKLLRSKDLEVPEPIPCAIMIDTASDNNYLEKKIIEQLGLKPQLGDPVTSVDAKGNDQSGQAYIAQVILGLQPKLSVIGEFVERDFSEFEERGITGVIGRGVLQNYLLEINGLTGHVALTAL